MQPDHSNKKSIKIKKSSFVWPTALILSVLVMVSVAVAGACIYNYVHCSACEISLYKGQIKNQKAGRAKQAEQQRAILTSKAAKYSGTKAKQQSQKNAFNVKDADQVWETETAIELFKSQYTNKDGKVTVKSADGKHVIAPGTEGQYTFDIKNTSKTPANYKIWVEAKLSSNIEGVPLQTRMSGQNGWLLGSKNNWKQAASLDGVTTKENIGAGKTAEYTIYWQWPFEQGDDKADTDLANASVNQEMSYTVTIHTMAATSTDAAPNNNQQDQKKRTYLVQAVKAGDTAQILKWAVILGVSAGILLILLLKKRKNKEEQA